jgi:hypothetical protein
MNKTVLYNSTLTTDSGTFTYTVPNTNLSYILSFNANLEGHSDITSSVIATFTDAYAILEAIELPDILGTAGAKVQTFVVWMTITFIALLASAANIGYMAILLVIPLTGFYLMGWIGNLLELVIVTLVMGIMMLVIQSRKKEVSV